MPVVSIFNGRCIHGKAGARMEKGCLTNPLCGACQKMNEGESCGVGTPDSGEAFVGSNDEGKA